MNHQITSRKKEFQKKITIIEIEKPVETEELELFRRKIQNARRKAKSQKEQSYPVVYGASSI